MRFKWGIVLAAGLLWVSQTQAFCKEDYGDINEDGTVNVVDVQCLTNLSLYELNGNYAPGFVKNCATNVCLVDMNCDGKINVSDIQITIYKSLKFPLEKAIDADQNGVHDACEAYFDCESCMLDPQTHAPELYQGMCARAEFQCVNKKIECVPLFDPKAPPNEICGDLEDNDCDGRVDDVEDCTEPKVEPLFASEEAAKEAEESGVPGPSVTNLITDEADGNLNQGGGSLYIGRGGCSLVRIRH